MAFKVIINEWKFLWGNEQNESIFEKETISITEARLEAITAERNERME